MKFPFKIYINLTNRCNLKCPFCFMYSSPLNDINMKWEVFTSIIDNTFKDKHFEVQLGGGETTLYPQFIQAVEYCLKNTNVDIVMIDTNGFTLSSYIQSLYQLSEQYQKPIILKISINYWLIKQRPTHIKQLENILQNYQNAKFLRYIPSIRYRMPQSLDQDIFMELKQSPTFNNIKWIGHPIEFIGRAKDLGVSNLTISNDIIPHYCLPIIFASDGKCFYEDWNGRMNYEKSIAKDPV